jgi:hypothetical protein
MTSLLSLVQLRKRGINTAGVIIGPSGANAWRAHREANGFCPRGPAFVCSNDVAPICDREAKQNDNVDNHNARPNSQIAVPVPTIFWTFMP